jgi:hypothetical protein
MWIGRSELRHGEAGYDKPCRHHHTGDQHIVPESAFPVIRRHVFHR